MRRLGVAGVALLGLLASVLGTATPSGAAPASAVASERGGVIPGRFIVTLHDGADARSVASEYRRRGGTTVDYVYTAALNGFAGTMSDGAVARARADGRVERVEADQVVTVNATQTPATWGIDRIDQRSGTDLSYTYNDTGAGVTVYVIDTGILSSHTEFSGRLVGGYTSIHDGNGTEDCHGHGTHVAGTAGGTVYGVAKGVKLSAVRVLSCSGSGTWSGVVDGVDFVTRQKVAHPTVPMVANMSLGGGASSSLDAAVQSSIAKGVTYAVAAGNGNNGGKEQDACGYSPARVPTAITVGATTSSDAKTSWSNYGDCVDWFAPGASITSAYHTGTTASATMSGTSMSSPHVAGVAALYLEDNPTATAQAVRDALYSFTTKGIVTSSKTTNNHLLFSLEVVHGAPPPPATAPGAPQNLSATGGAGKVDLTWDAPSSDGGSAITGYKVYKGTTSGALSLLTTVTTRSHTDSLVESGTTYYYAVSAVNAVGEGALSAEKSATPTSGEGSTGGVTLTPSSQNNGGTWTAIVTVSGLAPNTSASGTWSDGASGTGSCDQQSGSCDISYSGIPKKVSSVTFTLEDPSGVAPVTVTKP